jgi:transcriptional regulator with XRE-family HTH domain
MMTPEAVGITVRRARTRQNWSQSELASRAGVTREWVGRLERGAPRLEFDKVLKALAILGLRLEAPADETVTSADIELADDIAWSMALEDRKLTSRAYDKLLDKIVSDRLAREQGEAVI